MATIQKRGKPLLGIDITPTEIRAIEISGIWSKPEIINADWLPLPPGSMFEGEIIRPDLVAKALTQLLASMQVTSRNVVMGVPTNKIATRVIDVPQVPENEFDALIQGEIKHQRILATPGGKYACHHLDTRDAGGRGRPRVVLMAAELAAIQPYLAIANLAGLKLIGLEPGLIGLFRCAAAFDPEPKPTLYLMVGSTATELAIAENGPLRLYRRIDMGSRELLTDMATIGQTDDLEIPFPPASAPQRTNLAGDVEAPEREFSPLENISNTAGQSDESSANQLLMELSRSMDYYYREYPEAKLLERIVVCSDTDLLEPLAHWLKQNTHVEAFWVELTQFASIENARLSVTVSAEEKTRYMASCGFALKVIDQIPSYLPSMDLMWRDPAETKKPVAYNHLVVALLLCILIMVGSCLNAIRLTHNLQTARERLTAVRREAKRLETYRGLKIEDLRMQTEMRDILVKPGATPIPAIVDAVCASVPEQASVFEISMEGSDATLMVTGDAGADSVLVRMMDTMRQRPEFSKVSLDSLDRDVAAKTTKLHYQVSLNLQ